jgi:hypothetical protein
MVEQAEEHKLILFGVQMFDFEILIFFWNGSKTFKN